MISFKQWGLESELLVQSRHLAGLCVTGNSPPQKMQCLKGVLCMINWSKKGARRMREKLLATSSPKKDSTKDGKNRWGKKVWVTNVKSFPQCLCCSHQTAANVTLPLLSMHLEHACCCWCSQRMFPPSLTLSVSPARLLACSRSHQCDTQRLQRKTMLFTG